MNFFDVGKPCITCRQHFEFISAFILEFALSRSESFSRLVSWYSPLFLPKFFLEFIKDFFRKSVGFSQGLFQSFATNISKHSLNSFGNSSEKRRSSPKSNINKYYILLVGTTSGSHTFYTEYFNRVDTKDQSISKSGTSTQKLIRKNNVFNKNVFRRHSQIWLSSS